VTENVQSGKSTGRKQSRGQGGTGAISNGDFCFGEDRTFCNRTEEVASCTALPVLYRVT
jgi:hypothetical protein